MKNYFDIVFPKNQYTSLADYTDTLDFCMRESALSIYALIPKESFKKGSVALDQNFDLSITPKLS